MEFSQSLRKLVCSVGSKAKVRREEKLFIAEGTKCVLDTLGHFSLMCLICTERWLGEHSYEIAEIAECMIVRKSDIERMSALSTPSEVIALYRIPEVSLDLPSLTKELVVALDTVQDPGNLGTIIRICDWMGINDILCSDSTVDVYSPKVVQATMGAISRVRLHYCRLSEVLDRLRENDDTYEVYGTYLDGENIYSSILSTRGVIVMGNEGHGISEEVSRRVNRRLTIPSFHCGPTSESLNVAVATAITLSEFRRRTL